MRTPIAKPRRTAPATAKPAKPGAFFTYEVDLGTSYGCPEPRLNVKPGSRGAHFRAVRAELFRLAGLIEHASIPGCELWVVGTKSASDSEGCVYLEMAGNVGSAGAREIDRAMALLKEIANQQG